ncbi:inovirus-type Gp2 protein [Halomonas sp. HP20-15]|uniref:YagK/YfjJ domain-containing protein n=1 Tax=Halomonas sp. HP20-15 TaxID=3085901 RepID=UPI002980E49C|nr:inovirus-type Gp2 protein [Halomonas sp. HP20-15]MDW5376396.1 inovirus-type Gp2 protein [Halomonas sp. HP20-15]
MKLPPKRSTANSNHTLHWQPFFSPKAGIDLPVLTARGPLVVEYLHRTYEVFERALEVHSKVIVCCFTLTLPHGITLPEDIESNGPIVRFIASAKSKVRADLKRKGSPHKCPVRYVIAREMSGNGRTHYHVVLLVNGHVYRTVGTIDYEGINLFWMVAEAWASALRIELVEAVTRVKTGNRHSKLSYYFLTRESGQANLDDAFRRASYLCKRDTKQFGDRYRGLLTSEI